VAWRGPCSNQGVARGISVGNADGAGRHDVTLPVDATVPNRYLSGFAVDPRKTLRVTRPPPENAVRPAAAVRARSWPNQRRSSSPTWKPSTVRARFPSRAGMRMALG